MSCTDDTDLKSFIHEFMGDNWKCNDAAELIGHTYHGMKKMLKRDPTKLKALLIGYRELAKTEKHGEHRAA